jgi:hypothetical protein
MSSSVDDDMELLGQLLGGTIEDEVLKSKLLSQKISELRSAETGAGPLDLRVLLPLLAGGASAAFGGRTGQGIGAGLALGGIQNIGNIKEAEEAQRQTAIEDLEDRQEKAETRIEKHRNRLATMINTNPELFMNPDGTVPDPKLLGLLITGEDIPLYPQTRRLQERRDKRWDAQWSFFEEALGKARTPEDAAPIMQMMMSHLTETGASPVPKGAQTALINALGTPDFDNAFANTLIRYGGASALEAIKVAGERRLPLHHPEIIRLIKFSGDDMLSPSEKMTQRFINLVDEMNRWAKESPDLHQAIIDKAGTPGEELRLMADVVFADRPGDKTIFFDKGNLPKDTSLAELLQSYGLFDKNFDLANIVAQAKELQLVKQLSPDQFRQYKMNGSLDFLRGAKATAEENAGRRMAGLRNKKRLEITATLPKASDESIRLILNLAMEGALERAKKNPDGSVDVADWERQIDALIPVFIKAFQEEQPNPQQ